MEVAYNEFNQLVPDLCSILVFSEVLVRLLVPAMTVHGLVGRLVNNRDNYHCYGPKMQQ